VGGHSIRDDEIKFGYAVTGTIHPARVLTNAGALPGDRLLLTKPLGTGVISTAIKRGKALSDWVDGAVASMTTLNKTATEVIADGGYAVHGVTDVTGFGLIGHAREVARASNVSLHLRTRDLPLIEGALECVRAGHIPGGLKANREFAECVVEYDPGVSEDVRTMLFDPQTAGGLLVSVGTEDCDKLARALRAAGVNAVEIGEVLESGKPMIRVSV
jgi:selenide,water dikinase